MYIQVKIKLMASFPERLKKLRLVRKLVYAIVGAVTYPGLTMVNRLKITGTEHLRTKKRLVTVYYGIDDQRFELKPGIYTTEQLIAIFPVPEGYLLNLLEDGVLVTLKPDQKTHIKNGMHFSSQPPGGGSS